MIYQRTKMLASGRVFKYPHWWYRFKRNGIQIRVNTKQANKQTAVELEAAHRTRLARGEAGLRDDRDVPTLKAFKERFTEAVELRCADRPSTVDFYKRKLKNLLAYVPLANAKLNRIDESLIERYVHHRRKQFVRSGTEDGQLKHISPAAVNRELATLRRALRLALEWKILDRAPSIKLLPGEHVREFVLGKSDEVKYLAVCPSPLKEFSTLILDTGLRRGEALQLRWADVQINRGDGGKAYIQIRNGKSKNAKRAVSLTERVAKLLAEMKETAVDQHVFSSGSGPYSASYISHLHQRGRDKLGFPMDFVVHSLRHTMLTRLGEAGVDAFTLMRIAGHSNVTVSQRYVHPSTDAVERAIVKLEGHMAGTLNTEEEAEISVTASKY